MFLLNPIGGSGMKSMMRSLYCLISLTVATFAYASGGGGGGGGGSGFGTSWEKDPNYTEAEKAIEAEQWDKAIPLLMKSLAKNDQNADAYNYLGFAERHRGNLDAAFKYYDRALAIDPKHRGVHEYLGEAYLTKGDVGKAEAELAKLDDLCFLPCDEYKDLKQKIADYKEKKK
jgi:tetratricopeptide (TPR) repeat protein